MVYEHDEDVSSHLGLLCHVCILLADHDEHLVASAAQQLLTNCLYSLSHHYKDVMQEERQPVDCSQASKNVLLRGLPVSACFECAAACGRL